MLSKISFLLKPTINASLKQKNINIFNKNIIMLFISSNYIISIGRKSEDSFYSQGKMNTREYNTPV